MKRVVVALLVFALLGSAIGTTALLTSQNESEDDERTRPLAITAATFPVPSEVEQALPDTVTDTPPTAIRAWRSDESIDAACGRWRDAFRNWVDASNVGDVDGETIQGQSCTLDATKDGFNVRLQVAVYATAPPQATLTVTE